MKVNGKHYRTIWVKPDDEKVIQIIDQRKLPHKFVIEDLKTSEDFATAIKEMHVRGAGLIGASAGYGMYIGCFEAFEACEKTNDLEKFDRIIYEIGEKLKATRPTAVNLEYAVNRQLEEIRKENSTRKKIFAAFETADKIADEDVNCCKKIGECGLQLIKNIYNKKQDVVNILTHCNAGWLAFVDYGSALSPVYATHDLGIKVHVWVSETRPVNQGSRLTAWELSHEGISHSIIVDNTAGHLMQKGLVDLVITGADRVTYTGDVVNKIGTYLKALAAKNNNVPFYVALPSSTFDWNTENGKEIIIEERNEDEVKYVHGKYYHEIKKVLITPQLSPATNYAFDVTPRNLVTGLITERGICSPSEKDILRLYPEKNYRRG